jgi:glycosyltransferase involved in cell wall biosynthesis
VRLYRPAVRSVDGVIAVNQELAHWSIDQLGMQASMVRYIPNFVVDHQKGSPSDIPGVRGYRIVNVANLRPQKDHLTLIQAMKIVTAREPKAHLILVGSDVDKETSGKIWKEIASLDLSTNITWLGLREDVQDILINCDIGIISSVSEGLPLALLEYGQAGLAVISTNVGECPGVLDQG